MRNFKIGRTWGVLGKQQTFYGPTHFMGEKVPLNNNPFNSWDVKKSNYRRIDGMSNDAQQGGVDPQDTPTPTPTPSPLPQFNLLTESGDFILSENGDFINIEN